MNRTHAEIFTDIYARNVWGGSGGGSTPEATVEYRKLLTEFLKANNITSVVDFGCGDWAFSKLIDWSGIDYTGIDCVRSVVMENEKKYSYYSVDGETNIHFHHLTDTYAYCADLLILKDVLQHWTNEEIVKFLREKVKYFKHILITNTCNQERDDQDSANPALQTRPLSAKYFPLKEFYPVILMTTNGNDPKETCVITP